MALASLVRPQAQDKAAWFGTPVPPPQSDPRQPVMKYDDVCHSSGDVFEAVPAEGMERAARFHAFLIEQADRAPEALITAGKGSPYKAASTDCTLAFRQ